VHSASDLSVATDRVVAVVDVSRAAVAAVAVRLRTDDEPRAADVARIVVQTPAAAAGGFAVA